MSVLTRSFLHTDVRMLCAPILGTKANKVVKLLLHLLFGPTGQNLMTT